MQAAAYKRWPTCGERKPLTEFSRDPKKPRGRGAYCKPCGAQGAR
jgi:hypothetical protein